MIMYRINEKVLYFAAGADAPVHFVPTVHWNMYLKHRKNTPQLCKIFDTIRKAEEVAAVQ